MHQRALNDSSIFTQMPLGKLGSVTAVAWNDSWEGTITKHDAHGPEAEAGAEPEAR